MADGPMVVLPIGWSGRNWALPFLTILAPWARLEREAPQAAQDPQRNYTHRYRQKHYG